MTCGALTPQLAADLAPVILEAELDVLIIHGTVVSAEHVAKRVEPLNLKQFIRELDIPVVVGGCASYQAALHLMRTGAVGILVGLSPGGASTTRDVLGIDVATATAIADVVGARSQHLEESGVYVQVIADMGPGTAAEVVKAIACGADAVMLGGALAGATGAPGHGHYWGIGAAHASLPAGDDARHRGGRGPADHPPRPGSRGRREDQPLRGAPPGDGDVRLREHPRVPQGRARDRPAERPAGRRRRGDRLRVTATARTLAGAFTSRRADLFGIGWVLLFALLFLSPALKDGPQFAPADLGAGNSPITAGALALSHDCLPAPGQATPPTSCPHNGIDGDEITQAIPWNTTNWKLVHAGHFPLWNDLEGNGLPQFLNFESGTLALPSLVGYLVPLPESFLVTVLMKLLIAGIGSYLLCRLLACRPLAAAFGGVSFMLSGAFAGWLGWSISGTLCWVGAIAAAALWSYRRARRALPVTLLAGAVAFSLYGGFVEAYLLLAGFFCLVALAGALAMALNRRPIAARGLGRVAGGVLAGTALAAPLWLTGASLLRASVRSGEVSAHGIAVKGVALAFAQGYYGLPLAGSTFFGTGLPNYYESAAYVGVLALVLVGVALLCAWRRPAVVAFAAAAVGSLLVAYRLGPVSPVQRLVIDLGLGAVDIDRVLPLVGFAIAILSALGLELLVARHAEAVLRRALAASLLVVTIALAALGVGTRWSAFAPPTRHCARRASTGRWRRSSSLPLRRSCCSTPEPPPDCGRCRRGDPRGSRPRRTERLSALRRGRDQLLRRRRLPPDGGDDAPDAPRRLLARRARQSPQRRLLPPPAGGLLPERERRLRRRRAGRARPDDPEGLLRFLAAARGRPDERRGLCRVRRRRGGQPLRPRRAHGRPSRAPTAHASSSPPPPIRRRRG